jgi:phenylalanyl-tRNA synthetase beta chain
VFFPPDAEAAARRPVYDGVFHGDGALLPDEHEHLAAVRSGMVGRRPFETDRPVEPADAVAVINALRDALRLHDLRLEGARLPGYYPGRAAHVVVDGIVIGTVGEVAGDVARAHELAGVAVALEIDIDLLLAGARRDAAYVPVSKFPASSIDLAFIVHDDVPAAAVERVLRATAGELLEAVSLFDIFEGGALSPGQRSLAFSLQFRSPERTLTNEEVGELRQRCIDAVAQELGAQLRQ